MDSDDDLFGASDTLYTQLIVHAGGHCIALLLGLLVYGVWTLLQDYRDAIIWALLCSIPLRSCKLWLVGYWTAKLKRDLTLFAIGMEVFCLPIQMLKASILDSWEFFSRWRRFAFEYEAEVKEHTRQSRMDGPGAPLHTDRLAERDRIDDNMGGRGKIQTQPGKTRKASDLPAFFGGLVKIGHLGWKAWRSEKPALAPLWHPAASKAKMSNTIIRGLLVACVFYQSFWWIHSSWSGTLNILLLTGTALASVSVLPFLYLAAHLYLSLSAPEGGQRRSQSLSAGESSQSEKNVSARAEEVKAKDISGTGTPSASALGRLHTTYRSLDARVKSVITGCIHSLAAAFLVVALLAGAFLLVVFVFVRIGQESSSALIAATDAARNWSPASDDSNSLHIPQNWLLEQQASVGHMVEQSLPNAIAWAEYQVGNVVDAYNLTQVVDAVKTLHATAVPIRACSDFQKEQFLIALALASAQAEKATHEHEHVSTQIRVTKERLKAALSEWEFSQPRREASAVQGSGPFAAARAAVIALSQHLQALEEAHIPAHRAVDESTEEARRAEKDVLACFRLQNEQPGEDGAIVHVLGQQLRTAYSHLWNLQIQDGLLELKDFWARVCSLGGQMISGNGDMKEVGAVHRLGHAAADPLLSVSRNLAGVLVSGAYFTSTLLFSGGLGIFKFGVGVLKFGVQMLVFLALLFYLLAAETDPLMSLPKLLPLSDATQQRVSVAFSSAISGVIISAVKLSVFHALFTWLSLSVFSVHLVYMCTVASAVLAFLPFIPSWLVSLPAAAQLLLLQERPMAALVLLALHFGAWYIADDIILREIPSSHPYLTGLGIFGGIATFSNPLQGAIFGPLALSMLSVLYNLHLESRSASTQPSRS